MKSIGTRQAGEDWPHFLGPNFDNTSQEKGIVTDWSNGQLRLLWSRPVGTSYGIGSVAKGRYLQFERVGDQERLTCLNAETGEELWHSDQPVAYEDLYGYNNGPRTSPTINGDLVYTLGVAGQLTCRNLADGMTMWTKNVNDLYGVVQNFFGVGASPLVIDDKVIVMVGGSPAADQKLPPGALDRVTPNGSAIVAFNRHDGSELFRTGNYLASYSSPRPFQFKDQTWILAFVREGLLAINSGDGKEQWMYPWRSSRLESVNAAVPVVSDNEIFISECYDVGSALLKINDNGEVETVRKDEENRRLQTFRAHWATPLKIGDYLYGSSGRNPGDTDFRCINWSTGEPKWVVPRRERTSLLGIDGHVIILGEYGELSLATASPDGIEIASTINLSQRDPAQPDRPRMRPPMWAAPIVSHGLLYVRCEQFVVCFELIPQH